MSVKREVENSRTRRADEQEPEPEAGVTKLHCPFVGDGLEPKPLEECGEHGKALSKIT